MDELLKYDNTFSKETFISKANNILVMLYTSIMANNLSRVDHFIGDKLYQEKEKELEILNKKNLIQVYENFNIKLSIITNIKVLEENMIIELNVFYNYLGYQIDRDTKEIINGSKNHLIEKNSTLIFSKKKDFKQLKESRKCPNCGAVMDLNNNGLCNYCKKVFSQENYDWILVDIK